jgi:hypothetical protein
MSSISVDVWVSIDFFLCEHEQNVQLVCKAFVVVDSFRHPSSSQQFNEIMPCIYARFMEKEAKQWREIYKVIYKFIS